MQQRVSLKDLKKISDVIYEIPKTFRADMRVDARVFTNAPMLADIVSDRSLDQLVNVTTLPGICGAAYAMPDIHQGYGFPIGGVAATLIEHDGVISPGGIGYDINCGVRLMRSNVKYAAAKHELERLAEMLLHTIPSGTGRGGNIKLDEHELDLVLKQGARRAIELGYGNLEDLRLCEEGGAMTSADPAAVSVHAKNRGFDQLGTLGSGNHFLEVQRVEHIFDEQCAKAFGLETDMLVVMIHCGSRGLGHQVCTDYVRLMLSKINDWKITLPDRELACAPFNSPEGQQYFAAMSGAANFAWANRQIIGHLVAKAWSALFGQQASLNLVYDVCHNIGKTEEHMVDGKQRRVLVHRKGATRAFGPGHESIPAIYRSVGQPVFIPGTMGTSSYVLAGMQQAMQLSFGSACHGAGRRLSRIGAKKMVSGSQLRKELAQRGIIIKCESSAGLAEEAPIAYKDVDNVVDVVVQAGIAKKVAKLAPLAVIKGG